MVVAHPHREDRCRNGMPRSVIATGLVDEVLEPPRLAARVAGHVAHQQKPSVKLPKGRDHDAIPLEGVLTLLHDRGGVNFRD